MDDAVDPAELARLRARTGWHQAEGGREAGEARRRAECDAARGGHLEVVMTPDAVPHCAHCGESLSPDALRRAGIQGRRA